jgi:hypothetical protein
MKSSNLRLAAASVIAGYRSAGAEGSLENRRFSGEDTYTPCRKLQRAILSDMSL